MKIHQYFKTLVSVHYTDSEQLEEIDGRYDFTKTDKRDFNSVKSEIDKTLLKRSDIFDWNILDVIYADSALELKNYE